MEKCSNDLISVVPKRANRRQKEDRDTFLEEQKDEMLKVLYTMQIIASGMFFPCPYYTSILRIHPSDSMQLDKHRQVRIAMYQASLTQEVKRVTVGDDSDRQTLAKMERKKTNRQAHIQR